MKRLKVRLDIEQKGEVLLISLRGTAAGLRVGDPGQLKARQPSRIEKLFQNKQANLLWQGIMELLGLVGAALGVWQVAASHKNQKQSNIFY